MKNLWRLQTNTNGGKIVPFCLQKKIAAFGWSFTDKQIDELKESNVTSEEKEKMKRDRYNISTVDEYKKFFTERMKGWGNLTPNFTRITEEMEENDLIWMRDKGHYFLGRVLENSEWQYNCSDEALQFDAANQRTNIDWHFVGDESDVPGAVATALIAGSTLQRINHDGAKKFSMLRYNEMVGKDIYKDINLENNAETFFKMISPIDCEDLLCMWLYHKYEYVCIPSTNKKGTQLYECVLVDPKDGKHVYPQVKNGAERLDSCDYEKLDGEVWLLTTEGTIDGKKWNEVKLPDNMNAVNPEELFEFAMSDEGIKILPGNIIKWKNYILANSEAK